MLRVAFALGLTLLTTFPAFADEPFRFDDGDRVVLLGGTLIEREQKYGRWEEALVAFNAPRNFTLRNLGWSGDTVYGESRASFDPPPKGYERLVTLTKSLNPTVVVICYGANESFDGDAGLDRFRKGLTKLLDDLAPTKARVVLLAPPRFEPTNGATDVAARNANLAKYAAVLEGTATAHKLGFRSLAAAPPATENGLHLNDTGYRTLAPLLFSTAVAPVDAPALRAKLVEKNQLFFHRWRPQNETYLFGFRKHEQGKNGAEIPQFDPLIEKHEAEIAVMVKTLPAK